MNQLICKHILPSKLCVLLICLNFNLSTNAQTFINFELGALFIGVIDIRNGNNGTLFSLKNDFSTSVSPCFRLRTGFLLNKEHHFSFLYAPLKIVESVIKERNLLFDEKDFKANLPIAIVYKFNSYRLTYNRRIVIKDNFKFGLGLSAKIRDAGVSLKNKELLSENFSIGFVPLVNLLANYDLSQKMGIDFFGEGIIASKGRAIDISLSGRYILTENLQGNIGYRLLEGGADGTNRYNFIQLHFIFASLNYSFDKKNKEP